MIISKSDYLKYYQCPKALWLYKNRKELIPADYDESKAGVVLSGAAVEEEAYKLFPDGVRINRRGFKDAIEETTRLVLAKTPVIFQPSFWSEDLYSRADIIKYVPADNTWEIYEVKSATSLKKEYLPDVAFQKITLEAAGLKVSKAFVIYINKDYVRQGAVEPAKLFLTADVTALVNGLIDKTRFAIEDMGKLIGEGEEPQVRIVKQCEDPYPCMFIGYCWRAIPAHSIYNVYFNAETINEMLDRGIVELADVPAGVIVKPKYARYHRALKEDRIRINKNAIRKELDHYRYPLYFLDYETNSPAVPMFDDYRPYQRIIFQYSLHVLEKPGGELKHYAYLDDKPGDPSPRLAAKLKGEVGKDGSVIAWFKIFEEGCNREMGERYPAYAKFFESVNGRLLDLMDFFAKGYYVDKDFYGSASLKKVLPVIAPHLSYEELNIREGLAASASWPKITGGDLKAGEREELKSDMLAYCKLDTLAMVEIFRILNKLTGE
ncbi:MAG: DUF2779 domain-containing protein [Planctomycetes bacterium]|jgi:CRISPR/Cas system-associated exonuclease Cas4 (RecB family)|nr:DUF2779 domain-containing protein [Planctomycetota bacterium]